MPLIDKELSSSRWYTLTNTWDFQLTYDEGWILQAAQNRILSRAWSWIYDESFWGLLTDIRNTAITNITESQISGYIEKSLEELLRDNRIKSILGITILEKGSDYIQVEIKLDLDASIWVLNINIPA